jgi:hypothetical protein
LGAIFCSSPTISGSAFPVRYQRNPCPFNGDFFGLPANDYASNPQNPAMADAYRRKRRTELKV